MTEPTDRDIIDGCINGDRALRDLFVRRFSNLVYGAIQGVFKVRQRPMVREDLDDLHNSVFMVLFDRDCRKLSQYEGRNGCSLASWVRMIAVRHVLDDFRKQGHAYMVNEDIEDLEFLDGVVPAEPGPETRIDAKERLVIIEQALEEMLPRDRLLIRLHCFDELPLEQVARMMDVSANTVYSVKSRAIQRLKDRICEMMPP